MTLIDVESLLAPIDAERACGIELDYDPDYLELERSVEGQPERQYGDTVIPAEGPDWSRVAAQATSLLGKSKDFRLTVIVTRALARKHGIGGAVAGLTLTLELARRHWHEAYPPLRIDGELDPLPRGNALNGLTAAGGLIGDLRATSLATRQLGALDFGTLEKIASGRDPAGAGPIDRHQLEQLLQEETAAGNRTLHQLVELRTLAQELAQLCREHMGSTDAPDLELLIAWIDQIYPVQLSRGDGSNVQADSQADGADAAAANSDESGVPRKALTRQDALRMLDAVCAFLEDSEPANPAPLLIRRARGLIGRDFLSILRELAPDGLAQAELLTGTARRE